MTRPLYNLEIKAFHCSVELWLNDIIVFSHFEEKGSIWVDWPINQYILEKGIQSYEIRIIPYKNQTALTENVEVEFGIHAIEAITENERLEIVEKKAINIENKTKLPIYIHKGAFFAETPYVLEGWKNSVDLSKEVEKNIYKELIEWNLKLLEIYKTSDLVQYNKIYKERESEFDKSNYILSEPNTMDVFHSKFKDLIAVPNDLYKLVFFANSKLVSLQLPYELPGFTYKPKVENKESLGISLIIYFHRKEKGFPLEVIR
ncbi:hypothetical protein SY27_08095 [Flavobacterium sp. 316]|uniref:hypothetical protein n=1 Tax=Flavobacterium sp. 316 TaxID=1603293 RepID=UPI0005EA1485|nr:hypothetical protein [Flavobacterium sp. 316]KIX21647.1 hypothetical protein SY27_08095 [Flavobacterium sp. 316]